MSSLDAAILNVVIERGADDGSAGSIGALRLATIYFDADGVAVAGGTDTLGVQLNTAIQNSVRDGKTVTASSGIDLTKGRLFWAFQQPRTTP